jgi:hypothetical protein
MKVSVAAEEDVVCVRPETDVEEMVADGVKEEIAMSAEVAVGDDCLTTEVMNVADV